MAGLRIRALLAAVGERLLRAGDPWIARRVRQVLGDAADHGRLALDGTTLRVDGARIPLGDKLALTDAHLAIGDVLGLVARGETHVRIERAELGGVAGFPTIEASANASVSTSRWRVDGGEVSFGGSSVTVEGSGSFGDAPMACVRVKVTRLGAEPVRRLLAAFVHAEPLRSIVIADDVVVTGEITWNLGASTTFVLVVATPRSRVTVDFALDAHGKIGDIEIGGEISLSDVTRTGIAPSSVATRIDALAGARASLTTVVASTGAISGPVIITTATSKLDVALAISADRVLTGTAVRGTLSYADAFAVGLFGGAIRPRRIGTIDIDASLRGALTDPTLAGRASSADLRLRLGDDPALPTIFFADVEVAIEVDARLLMWRGLRARVFGGSIASSGSFAFDPISVDTSIECMGVRLETIVADADGTMPLARQLHGALHANLQILYAAGALPPFSVRGPVRVIEPDFLFLSSAADKLAKYGLPAPSTRGAGPIEAEIDVREKVARITPIAARLDGIDVDGDVTIAFDGAMQGRIHAHLLQGYLRRSMLLAVPAALVDRVTIPITIAGTVREPDINADFVQTFDNLLQKSAIGGAVTGVMDEIWSTFGGPRASRSSRPPAPPKSDPLDAIFDRILAGDPDSDDLIDDLADAGLDAEEIESRLNARRRRG